jgi:hypothetical protein
MLRLLLLHRYLLAAQMPKEQTLALHGLTIFISYLPTVLA